MSTESVHLSQSPPATFQPYSFSDVPHRENHGILYQVSLIAIDTLILAGSTYSVYQATHTLSNASSLASSAVVVCVWITLLHINGLYNSKLTRPAHQLAYDLVKTSGMSILGGSALFFLIPSLAVPREVHWTSALLAGLLLLLWRITQLHAFPAPQVKKRALFVGPTLSGLQIAEEIQNNPDSNYKVIGFIENQGVDQLASPRLILGDEMNLPAIVRAYQIHSIILPVSDQIPESMLKAISDCSELDCELISTSRLYEQVFGRIPVQHITHGWFISELSNSNRAAYRAGKRLMDVGLSALGLLATGLLFPFIALLIKLDSPGPVFYSQVRAGKNGKPFKIYKFRSMVHNAERDGAVWAQVNDKRVTKLGEFLRKTRLDELPQLYNVLLGEMSLVGPRPERPEFIEQLSNDIPFFNKRQIILPGLTGWAQINYPYGASTQDALEKLQYDLYYIKNRSMFLDIEIILKTISVVVKKQGAR